MTVIRILKHELAWRLWLFLIIFLQAISMSFAYKDRYCGSVDIRTTRTYGDPLINYENCTVVEGNVVIAVYNDTKAGEATFATFKNIRVVTGYVLLFFTENLRSLSRVLPNLRIIGGDDLIMDYSLIVSSNQGLYDIGISKLTAILNGGVYSTNNRDLCYVRSVNWGRLLQGPDRDIYIDEGASLKAEPCDYGTACNQEHSNLCLFENGKPMCWSKTSCQKVCQHDYDLVTVERNGGLHNTSKRIRGPGCDSHGRRCHEQCLGGCSKINDPGSCYYCRSINLNGTCVEGCPKGMFELRAPRRIRRCISEAECHKVSAEILEAFVEVEPLHIVDNICQIGCPAGMQKDEKNPYRCRKCAEEKGCIRKCPGDYLLHDGAELKRLFHGKCEIIDGNLEIELTDKVGYYMAGTLDETLSRLKEITGYLIIRFSTSLTSLRSFKNLKKIGGKSLYQNRFALAVFDNKNLVELLDPENGKGLVIERGSVQFQNNPQLCYKEILKLVRYAHLQNSTIDASPYSNGDQAICDQVNLTVWPADITHNSANIFWQAMDLNNTDHRKLLGYQIYYIEVPDNKSEVNIYEGRSACNDKWKMKFHPNPDEEGEMGNLTSINTVSLNETIQNLLPFKWYAFYVQTKVVKHNGSRQGLSKTEFFRTEPYKPSEPDDFQYKVAANHIRLGWLPPKFENGIVTHYVIEIEKQDDSYFVQNTAVCDAHGRRIATLKSASAWGEPSSLTMFGLDDVCSGTCKKMTTCCKCNQGEEGKENFQESVTNRHEIENHEKRVKLVSDMENKIQDAVFFEKSNSNRQRRHLSNDPFVTLHNETIDENCSVERDYYGDTAICYATRQSLIHKFKSTKLRAVIRGLEHYTYYRIKVSACHSGMTGSPGYCSHVPANVTVRTTELPENDIVKGIRIVSMNSSLEGKDRARTITWHDVENPNGAVLAYEVRLTPVGTDKADAVSKCINASEFRRTKSVVFYNLAEGTYEVGIQPITTAVANGSITDNISRMKTHLVVREPLLTWRTALKLLFAFTFLFVLVAVIVVIVTSKAVRKWAFGKEALLSFGFVDEDDDEYKPDEWDIDRNKIEFIKKIGAGRFGEVFYAKPLPDSGYSFVECAVKRSPLIDDALSRKHFIAEGQLMKNFDTTFIIKLYGISAEKGQPALIFLEYMEKGNLRDLLRERRAKHEQEYLRNLSKTKKKSRRTREGIDSNNDFSSNFVEDLPPKKLYNVGYGNSAVKLEQCFLWGAQIADAMAYLEAHQFVHRDLAARNVLVDGQENVKLGDFGLTRDVYYHEYYRPSGARPLPVRWMSPETMRDGIFTSKSDVWSYGIVLYEIFTLGERPYPHVDNDLVFDYVEKRNVNKKPLGCPTFWYNLMLDCWLFQPNSRPSFAQIVSKLLPFVEDPEFIKVSFTCNTAQDVIETEKIEFRDKDMASEKKQEDFVRMKVQEQQKTDAMIEKQERLRKVEQRLNLQRESEQQVNGAQRHTKALEKPTGGCGRKDSGKRNVHEQQNQVSLVSGKKKKRSRPNKPAIQLDIFETITKKNGKDDFYGEIANVSSDEEAKADYVEGLPPWKNGPLCKWNRRPNGLVKKAKKIQKLKTLHNGLENMPMDYKQLRLIKSMGNLSHASKHKDYDRITIEEDSV